MTNKPTKYYSSNQEKYIANVLGWEVISGSGAKDCHPGDIQSEDYLGECKTHMSETNSINIKHSWWIKIKGEALVRHKTPALFVDNGNLTNIWVITYYSKAMLKDTAGFPFNIRTNVIFKADALDKHAIYFINEWQAYSHCIVLMSLEKFNEIVSKR